MEVVGVGGCGEFQWRYWVLVDVGSFSGGSGYWWMCGVSVEVLDVGGCGEFQWRYWVLVDVWSFNGGREYGWIVG